jgi:hypothetical protein
MRENSKSNEHSRLPETYEEACRNPRIIVLGCEYLTSSYLCPGTCCFAKKESGKLEKVAQPD